jgi:hypothetical protein
MYVGQADQRCVFTVQCLLEGEGDLSCCLWTVGREVNGMKLGVLIKVLFPKHLVTYVQEFVL